MCGIAGFTSNLIDSFSDFLIQHRGKDGAGHFENEKVTLFHTRLSIIDLSANGIQPLYNEDKTLAIICNGEVYNYQEIRELLLNEGHQFSSNSDSEVILHLYEHFEKDKKKTVEKLIGMFAFAIWDATCDELWLVRDRLGIKPLYYYFNGQNLGFCSEINPLVKALKIEHDLDETSVFEYFLFGSVPEPNTWFKSIKALEPGNFLVFNAGEVNIEQYWDVQYLPDFRKTEKQWLSELEKQLLEIIGDHLVADVPVGCFLSAGIDSSLITYFSAKNDQKVTAFTLGFPGEVQDESEASKILAENLQIPHELHFLKNDFFSGFERHYQSIDQPFGIASGLNLSRVSELASKKVKVVLSGDGGDELFAGYDRHRPFYEPRSLRFVPVKLRCPVVNFLSNTVKIENFKKLDWYYKRPDYLKYADRYIVNSEIVALNLLSPDLQSKVDVNRYKARLEKIWNKLPNADLIHKMLYTDIKTTLVHEMLFKSDRFTMHNGIEGRVPLLDHRLVEFSFTMPASFKIKDGVGKWILRKLVELKLGGAIANRKKTGFSSPINSLLESDLKTQVTIDQAMELLEQIPFLNKRVIAEIKDVSEYKKLHPDFLFSLVALANFHSKNISISTNVN
ncbi:asparagine synthase (glutamine-hydrolyzing) [Mongoliitalea lutea]|uniref:asparagine synthase (glutamine-hydrolyzing) n=1 Tax=Mongoliitalea lutea TaxID=849756 RepID=A0A8J3G4W3_9BACT|nr:asparagine synthase (glutamine-hydrolyzing) [Mongoliitalea lutea]GHB31422.1 asparagine synthetase B [Mongoliitalea lutea]